MVETAVAAYRLGGVIALLVSVPGLGQTQQDAGSRVNQVVVSDSVAGHARSAVDEGQAVTFDLHATLADILREIVRQGEVELVYSKAVVPLDRRMSLKVTDVPAMRALAIVLQGLDVSVQPDGRAWLLVPKRHAGTTPPTGSIEGRITDAKTGDGVAQAEVFLEKTGWRTATDTAGRYRLAQADTGQYTLSVRRLGYAKQSRPVTVREGHTDTVDVVLVPVATRLDELVTTATGPRRRVDIANDVTTINADSVMQAAPIRSLTDLLENRVPGLTVQHTSGAPGDPARLRLRGAGSPLRSNDPIVIVDGVRVYAEQSAGRSGNLARSNGTGAALGGVYARAAPSPLDYVDPNTIETIEVLKGPSAATLYGQDAANGVIVITTKKGKAGPARWTASVEHGRTQIEGDYPELLFRAGHEFYHGAPVNCLASNTTAVGTPCQGDSVVLFQLLNDPALTVLDRGHRTSLSLTASGGSQALTYAVTGSYADEVGLVKLPTYEADRYQSLLGVVPPAWMQRPQHFTQWGATSRITARLGPKAEVSLMAGLSRTAQQKSALQDQLGNLMSTYLDRASGTYYRHVGFGGSPYPYARISPVANALNDYYERATAAATAFTNSVNLDYRPRSWLTLTAAAGLNVVQRADQLYFPRGPARPFGSANAVDTTGYVQDGHGTSVVSTVNLQANALAPLGRGFQFRFALGANYTGASTNDIAGGSRDLPPGTSLGGSIVAFFTPNETSDATFGYYLDPSVGNSRFNFSSGLRLDGGKAYGSGVSGFRLPKFPKLGLTYLLSDEPWFPLKTLVQSLRVRVAFGKSSRQPGLTDRLRLYTSPQQVPNDGQSQTAVQLQTLGNTEVRPEQVTEFEGGFDAYLFDSRLSVAVSGYRKTTDDMLLSVPVAPSVYGGRAHFVKNIGVVRNTGLELTVGAQVLRGGPVTWGTQLSVSQNRNVVVKLGPGIEPFYTEATIDGALVGGERVAAGYPLFGRWSRPVLGYADANGNGLLEPSEIQLGDTAVYVGPTVPNYTAGFSTTISLWHVVDVHADFAYNDGMSQRNDVAQSLGVFSRGQQDPAASLDEQLATANLGRVNPNGLEFSILSDYNWIQTVSTTRFSSVSVRYRVPETVAHRLGAQTLSVAVQGANLALWTNYRGIDPNVNAFGTGNSVTDTGILPQPRTWQLRVDATY